MVTGVSSDLDSMKDALYQGAAQLTKGKGIYEETLRILETKKNEPVPQAKNPTLQEELNKTHAVYKNWTEASIINTKAQLDIEQELKALFEREIDLFTFSNSLTEIRSRLNPLLEEHRKNDAEIKKLEDRISVLIS